ncbi:right-handed parallel beta-helix repeat-containing protein [Streptomyces sp. 150FB]|uniref:right-handed parallel beta-helix repeat-containing protein n=1 Tax=Streptomyces sp. 150FB TaxID=1576605 RepID=UPI001F1B9117|nr:right-handed parallel beta-helix repeat-containing protein [Streptomyces sp. 150FB]
MTVPNGNYQSSRLDFHRPFSQGVVMRSTRTVSGVSAAVLLAAGTAILLPGTAEARAASVACSEGALVAAVTATNAAGGGVITLAGGCTYNLTSAHAGDLVNGGDGLPPITTAITFEGDNNVITRSGSADFRIILVGTTGNLTLKGVTVNNGSAKGLLGLLPANGGGILNLGALTLTNSAVTNSKASGTGGGVHSGGGAAAVTFTGSTLSGNTAVGDGGGLYNTATATLTSSFVNGGNKGRRGGGIASVNGILTVTSTPVTANTATSTAGGVYRQSGTMTVTTSPISANTANNCTSSVPAVPSCVG